MKGTWPGLGDRIRQRLRQLGYWRGDDKPDVMRFAMEKRYIHTYVYKWLDGTSPERDNLERLAKDLGVHPAWLLFGETPPPLRRVKKGVILLVSSLLLAASGSVANATDGPQVRGNIDNFLVIGSWRRQGWPRWGLALQGFARLVGGTPCWA